MKINEQPVLKEMVLQEARMTKDRATFEFTEYFPAFILFHVTSEGIFLAHHFESKDKNRVTLLDLDGKPIKTGTMRSSSINTFYNGRMYYLIENQDEEQWELIAEEL